MKVILWGVLVVAAQASFGQITNMPQLVDPKLQVRAVVTNLAQPTSMEPVQRKRSTRFPSTGTSARFVESLPVELSVQKR